MGGYPKPEMGLLDRWGGELLITSIYAMGGLAMIAFAVRRKLRKFFIFPAIIVIAAGIVFKNNGMVSTHTLLGIGVLILAVGLFYYFRRPTPQLLDQS